MFCLENLTFFSTTDTQITYLHWTTWKAHRYSCSVALFTPWIWRYLNSLSLNLACATLILCRQKWKALLKAAAVRSPFPDNASQKMTMQQTTQWISQFYKVQKSWKNIPIGGLALVVMSHPFGCSKLLSNTFHVSQIPSLYFEEHLRYGVAICIKLAGNFASSCQESWHGHSKQHSKLLSSTKYLSYKPVMSPSSEEPSNLHQVAKEFASSCLGGGHTYTHTPFLECGRWTQKPFQWAQDQV